MKLQHMMAWLKNERPTWCHLLFYFTVLCAQHVSDINISIIRSLQLFCWITTLVVLFFVRCVLEIWCGWIGVVSVLQASATHWTKNNTTKVVIQQNSCKLLMMDILMSETCWAHKKLNKIASDIKLVFYTSTITMMHAPINIRFTWWLVFRTLEDWIVSWNRINIHITTVLWCVNHSNQAWRGRQADRFFTPNMTFMLSLYSVKRPSMIVVWVIGCVLPLFQWSQSSYNY